MLKHVDEENSEYPASAEYPVSTKQKKIPNIAGAPSIHAEQITWMSRPCFAKKIFTHWKMSFALVVLFRSLQYKKSSIMLPSCTYLTNAIS